MNIKKEDKNLFKKNTVIFRGNIAFEVPIKDIFSNELYGFKCRRCGHVWLPRDRNVAKIPYTCPNSRCHSNYWFLTREQAVELMKGRAKLAAIQHIKVEEVDNQLFKGKEDKKTIRKEVEKVQW